ncbi:uncharacterized protein CLUP02_17991 [Colletotrichum lupini]|uniref:Uncharacterized protein n=1 Tax=Colletotrichum lupini TaxID=145971 RepID=A0A9Q8WAB7_9PEZI|nr:uncharacterized protein CLUP02_17991 [Colletotrichum lupini]UQC76478.1 hypothetical protein CLUP02_17991 [Colletotrichum lupini]
MAATQLRLCRLTANYGIESLVHHERRFDISLFSTAEIEYCFWLMLDVRHEVAGEFFRFSQITPCMFTLGIKTAQVLWLKARQIRGSAAADMEVERLKNPVGIKYEPLPAEKHQATSKTTPRLKKGLTLPVTFQLAAIIFCPGQRKKSFGPPSLGLLYWATRAGGCWLFGLGDDFRDPLPEVSWLSTDIMKTCSLVFESFHLLYFRD